MKIKNQKMAGIYILMNNWAYLRKNHKIYTITNIVKQNKKIMTELKTNSYQ